MVVDVGLVLLLAVLAWKLNQLVDVAKEVRTELITARWEGNKRIKWLEREVERKGEGALPLGREFADREE